MYGGAVNLTDVGREWEDDRIMVTSLDGDAEACGICDEVWASKDLKLIPIYYNQFVAACPPCTRVG